MALVPANYTGLIVSNTGWTGKQFTQLANGISVGLTTYLVGNPLPIIISTDAGAPGIGAGVGALNPATCPVPALQGSLEAAMRSNGVLGTQVSQLALGLAIATCTYLATTQTITTHPAVAAGTGIGKFVGLEPASLAGSITSVTGYTGSQWAQLVSGISSGMVTFLLAAPQFIIPIAGPAAPGATAGVGTGKII